MHFDLEKIKRICYRPIYIGSFKIPFGIPIFSLFFVFLMGLFLRSCVTPQDRSISSESKIENNNITVPGINTSASSKIVNPIDLVELAKIIDDSISSGEEILSTDTKEKELKIAATKLYREGKYLEAAKAFKEFWDLGNKDPETLIYLNNALIESTAARHYVVAVVIPLIDRTSTLNGTLNEISNEVLQGVAKSQEEANLQLFTSNLYNEDYRELPNIEILKQKILQGERVKIILATDNNNREQGKKIASQLVRIPFLLGVVGHYSSDVTIDTLDTYNENKVVLISPNSNARKLINYQREFFFKSVPSIQTYTDTLVNYLIDTLEINKVAAFYNPARRSFSYSYWQEFKTKFERQKGEIVLKYDNLTAPQFNTEEVIKEIEREQIKQKQDIAILLFPEGRNTQTFDNAQQIIKLNDDLHWIIGAETLYSRKTIKLHQDKLLEKIAIAVPWQYSHGINANFVKESELAWQKKVSYRAAFSYDAIQVLLKALNETKISKPTSQDIRDRIILPNFSSQGATGTIRFDLQGNRQGENIELATIVKCESQPTNFVSVDRQDCLK